MVEEQQQQNVEAKIENALRSRFQYFIENSETVTMVSVRRLIEEDLGFEKYALDVHKRFIKEFIEKAVGVHGVNAGKKLLILWNLNEIDVYWSLDNPKALLPSLSKEVQKIPKDDQGSKSSEGNAGKHTNSTTGEVIESPTKPEENKDLREPVAEDEPKEEDSPVTGVLMSKVEAVGSQGVEISESRIKKAIWERADHIRANSEALTLVGARRLIEEDLGLQKSALDSFKRFINKQVEKVINSSIASKSAIGKETSGKHQSKAKEKSRTEQKSGSRDKHNDVVKDEKETQEKATQKGEAEKSDRMKRYRRPENETDISIKKPSKIAKKQLEKRSNDGDDEGVSEDGGSETSGEKPAKLKKAASTPVYGRHVEHLKSIIKACGMSVPPSVYKKAKQVPDSKRESFLSKELEDILSKEGLSKDPKEREIKEVKKRKERAKELEGIDISNIVTSSRRRSSTSFVALSIPKTLDEGGDKAKGTRKDNNINKNEKDGDDDRGGNEEEKEEEEEDDDDDDDDEDTDGDEDEGQHGEFNEDDGHESD